MDWKELIGKRILIWQLLPDMIDLPLYEVKLLEIFKPEQSSLAPEQYVLLKFERQDVEPGLARFWIQDTKVKLCGVLDG